MPRSTLSLLLLAALIFGQAMPVIGAPGWSLCIGVDGHVAVEPTHAAPSCQDLCADEDGDPEDHECLDLALTDGERLRETRPRPCPDMAETGIARPHPSVPLAGHLRARWAPPRTGASGVPPGLRSTVLLI
ncbi:MAG: hypothetical protein ACF8R7_04215 [Phycisphaerales bacterium JB039]